MEKIDILMATYNGSKFIEAQLRSLQSQTYKNWNLLIHDDGSSDDTIKIIENFMNQDSRIMLIKDGIRFHTASLNFMHLLRFSHAPYIIFCDQDDIWLEDKLEQMIKFAISHDKNEPLAVYSNSFVYDMSSNSINGFATLCHPKNLKDILFANSGIQGCALMFNRSLLKIINSKAPEIIAMHDHIITLAALTFGKLLYLPKRLMLYRRHSSTVTGPTTESSKASFKHFFQKGKTVLDKKHFDAIKCFYETYLDYIPSDKEDVYRSFLKFSARKNRISNAFHAYYEGYTLYQKKSILIVKILLRKMI